MTRGLFFALLFLFTVGSLYAILREDRRLTELTRPKVDGRQYRVTEVATSKPLTVTIPAASSSADALIPADQQSQLDIERARLEEIGRNLQSLQGRQAQANRYDGNEMMSRIDSGNAEIQNLSDLIEFQRMSLAEIDRQADQSLREQSSVAQATRDQIDANIRLLEEAIRQSRSQISLLQWNSIHVSQQKEGLEYWGGLLAEQSQQLQDLKLQRAGISATVLQQNRGITSQAEARRADVLANEDTLRAEISEIRQELVRLRATQAQARQSSTSLAEEIRQERENYLNQRKKVSELESSSAP